MIKILSTEYRDSDVVAVTYEIQKDDGTIVGDTININYYGIMDIYRLIKEHEAEHEQEEEQQPYQLANAWHLP